LSFLRRGLTRDPRVNAFLALSSRRRLMSRAKTINRVELKYCEGCGCLLTRPVGSALTFCAICEASHSKEQIYLTMPKKPSLRRPRLPIKVDLQGCADERAHPALRVCA
jgi:hypothetical protein